MTYVCLSLWQFLKRELEILAQVHQAAFQVPLNTHVILVTVKTCVLHFQVIESGKGQVSPTQRSYLTGTLSYRAPELLRGDPPTTKADIYSLGITLWQMASGYLPYSGQNQHVVAFGVVAYNLRPESGIPMCSSSQSEQLYSKMYRKCWNTNPNHRPTAQVVTEFFIDLKRRDI